MRSITSSIAACILIGLPVLTGCGHSTTWVDADPTGCDAQLVAHINMRHDAKTQGATICASNGKPQFLGRFRCKDNVLQASCRS